MGVAIASCSILYLHPFVLAPGRSLSKHCPFLSTLNLKKDIPSTSSGRTVFVKSHKPKFSAKLLPVYSVL
jgi:hypothetical protein